MKISVLFVAILLSINLFSCLRMPTLDKMLLPNNSVRSKLTMILIQVQQDDNTPKTISEFLDTLKGLLQKLQDDQALHKETHDKMNQQCNEEKVFRTSECTNAKSSLSSAQENQSKCQNSLDESNKQLPELKTTLTTYQTELERAQKARDAENAAYLERKAGFEDAVAFINDFIEYLKTKGNGKFDALTSFSQISEKILSHSARFGQLKVAIPVLVQLASFTKGMDVQASLPSANTYTSTKNQAGVAKLLEAIQALLHAIQTENDANEANENNALTTFTAYKAKLTGLINELISNIAATEEHIKEMVVCIAEEQQIIDAASSKLERNTQLLNSADAMCDEFDKNFVEATKNRLEEIETMEDIIVIVQKRFGKIAEDLKIYLENVKEGWLAYINSTEFHKFEEYQQRLGDDNSHGADLSTQDASGETNKSFGVGKF